MKEKILEAIRKKQIDVYQITENRMDALELYFIKRELDMRRMKKDCTYEVTVYRDFTEDGKKMRGYCTVHIFPEMDEETIDKIIADAFDAAYFVKNAYFEIPQGKKNDTVQMQSVLCAKTLEEIANAFVKALYAPDNRADAFINSAEFFVKREHISIWNSNGIDVSYEKNSVDGEFVVQCLSPMDVEQYQDFGYIDFDTEALKKQVEEALDTVRVRAEATKAPKKGNYTVLLSGKQMRELMQFYLDRSCAAYVYPGYSNYKKGMQIQGKEVLGEKINLTLRAVEPYSEEGIFMQDLTLLEEGELKAIYGNARFAYYLGEKPTGMYNAIKMENGTKTLAEMKEEPYLHVVSFSDFSMDTLGGYFGGEIRLAYLFDGDKVTPVTGGSINGNLVELQKEMIFSKERYKERDYDGPLAVKFKNVPVAGV